LNRQHAGSPDSGLTLSTAIFNLNLIFNSNLIFHPDSVSRISLISDFNLIFIFIYRFQIQLYSQA
jgi:hypothetical protein